MAEFRKREDINQELELLQHWSEMGAPRIDDVSRSLNSLVKSVDPRLMASAAPQAIDLTVSQAPPVFPPPRPTRPDAAEDDDLGLPVLEGLLPRDEPIPAEPPRRPAPDRRLVPVVAALLLLVAGGLFWVSRHPQLLQRARQPRATGTGSPAPSRTPLAAVPPATPQATAIPTAQPTAEPSSAPTATPLPTPAATGAALPAGQALPSALPGDRDPASAAPAPAEPRPAAATQAADGARAYVVKPGDSLYAIAAHHLGDGDRWPEIYHLNHPAVAQPDLIRPGTSLRLPASDRSAASGGLAAASAGHGVVMERVYTVKPGDTLPRIAARQLGDAGRARDLLALNRDRVTGAGTVQPGVTLRLPTASAGRGRLPAAGRHPVHTGGRGKAHVVRPGESLALLAARYLGSAKRWPELYALNSHKIASPHWIYPGQHLAIPVAAPVGRVRYVVRAGDSLWAIAARTHGNPLAWPAIYRMNQATVANPDRIYPGQALALPR